jgi:tRNA(fMet)-specific endonuclease VapC
VFLLDTDTCIDVLRGVAAVLEKIEGLSPDDCYVSSITVFELFTGAYLTRHPNREAGKVDRFLGVLSVVFFDRAAAKEATRLRAGLERTGKPIGPYDLLIAAQAISCDYTLVSANVREFGRIESLKLEDWRFS